MSPSFGIPTCGAIPTLADALATPEADVQRMFDRESR